jgi:DNA invertase Pin-like site-specific DNA recombinase
MSDSKERHVAIYARTANASQLSIESQEAELRRYAEKQGYTELSAYVDNGYSGVSLERPALRRLIADIESGKVGRVIVRDAARISRSYVQMGDFINILERNGVELDALDSFQEFCKSTIEKILSPTKRQNRGSKDRER